MMATEEASDGGGSEELALPGGGRSGSLVQPRREFTLNYYAQRKRDEKEWFSTPFFSAPRAGYKMCLGVFPAGTGDAKDTHLSLCIHIMRGEYDADLQWPFRGSVVVELLNQQANHTHHRRSVIFNDHTPAISSDRRPSLSQQDGSECSEEGWGLTKFIPHSELGLRKYTWFRGEYECQYLKNDALKFRIVNVVVTRFYCS